MSDAIKSHNTDNSIKSSRDIKNIENKIKQAEDKVIKNTEDNTQSMENSVIKNAEGISGASAIVTYAGAKFGYHLATTRQRRRIRAAHLRHDTMKAQFKALKNVSRERIKIAHKSYRNDKKEIKADAKNSSIKSSQNSQVRSQIKDSKYEYKAAKKAEKETIKSAKKALRTNWFEIIKMQFEAKVNKTLYGALAIILAVFVFGGAFALFISPSGILFTDDEEVDGGYSLTSAMMAINEEFAEKIKSIESVNTYDDEVINNYGRQYEIANWADIVAVWSVKYTFDDNVSFVIDEDAFQALRTVAWDMTSISGKLETRTEVDNSVPPTTTPTAQRPQPATKTVTTLIINVNYSSSDEMKEKYNFDEEQKEAVLEIFSDGDYLSLFEKVSAEGVAGADYSNDFAAKAENGKFIYPTSYHTISGGYPNYRSGKYHGALDFPCPTGTSVYAVGDGTVVAAQWHNSYGYYVKIDHGNNITTIVAHNSRLVVSVGQKVTQGQLVAYSGSTGNSTGPHCHFEVRVNNQRVNPKDYL